jgi:hypothetical protein
MGLGSSGFVIVSLLGTLTLPRVGVALGAGVGAIPISGPTLLIHLPINEGTALGALGVGASH